MLVTALNNHRHDLRPLAAGIALLGLIGLMAGFGTVVQQSVRQGNALQRASDLAAEAGWRCRVLKPLAQRTLCQQTMLQRQPTDSTAIQDIVAEAALSS